jgi:hypothetical protein
MMIGLTTAIHRRRQRLGWHTKPACAVFRQATTAAFADAAERFSATARREWAVL